MPRTLTPFTSAELIGDALCFRLGDSEGLVTPRPGFSLAGRLLVGPDPRCPMPEITIMTLSDTQAAILHKAAQHESGLALLPKIPAAASNVVFRSMTRTALLAEFRLCRLQDEAGGA